MRVLAGEIWDVPKLAIDWPQDGEPIVIDMDRHGAMLDQAETCA